MSRSGSAASKIRDQPFLNTFSSFSSSSSNHNARVNLYAPEDSDDDSHELTMQYADPDLLNPPLPEPYRSIDGILRTIIDDALTHVTSRDAAERQSRSWDAAKPCYPTALVPGLGVVLVDQ